MATESETLEILVRLKNEAERGLKELNQQLGKTSKTASLVNKTLAGFRGGLGRLSGAFFSIKGAIAGAGLAALSHSFISAADSAEQLQIRLRAILGSQKEANRLFEDASKFAAGVAFEYGDITQAATQMAGVMEGGVDEVNKWLPLVADLAATSGLGIQQTTEQVIRMYSAGAASADLFRERGILAMLGFQAGVSTSAEETRKRLIAAWEDPASRFRGTSEQLSSTWSGMLSMMSDAWLQFRQAVMRAGVFDFLRAALQLVVEDMQRLRKEGRLDVWAKQIADVVVTAMTRVAQAIAIVSDAWRGWRMIWEGLRGGFAAFAAFVNIGLQKLGDIVDLILGGIGGAIEGLGKLITGINFGPVNDQLAEALKTTGGILQHAGGTAEMTAENVKFWEQIVEEADKNLIQLAGQETAWTKVNRLLGRIRDRAAEYAAAAKAAGDEAARPRVKLTPEASLKTTVEFDLSKAQEIAKTGLAKLKDLYDQNVYDVQTYYNLRQKALEEGVERELAALRKLEEAETNVDKKVKLEQKIFAVKQKFERDKLELGTERRKAEEDAEKQHSNVMASLIELRSQIAADRPGAIQAQFEAERAALELQQQQRIQMLTDNKASEDQIEEAHRLHQLQRDQQVAKQRLRVYEMTSEGIKQTLGFMESAFADAYEASGKQTKEFFYLQKAAAVAQTAIATYEAAQKAYTSLVGIPYVGPVLAVAAAAAAIAAGLARVAKIKSQSLAMASGGMVPGKSPSPRSDDKMIRATSGEFMHPVSTVKYYGSRVMEAIRTKAIPREVLMQYAAPEFKKNYTAAFQTGGQVAASTASERKKSEQAQPDINLINVVDPTMMDQYVSSTHGQRNILNVISQNAFQVKGILQAEG